MELEASLTDKGNQCMEDEQKKNEASRQAVNLLEASKSPSPKASSCMPGASEPGKPKRVSQPQYGSCPAGVKRADRLFHQLMEKVTGHQQPDEELPSHRDEVRQSTDCPWLPPLGADGEYAWYSKTWHAYYHVYGPTEYDPVD